MEHESTLFILGGDLPAAPRVYDRRHCLEQISGAEVGRRLFVDELGLTLGRAPPAEVVLADSEVSRAHCRVVLSGGELVVTDLSSTNGSFIDDRRIVGDQPLKVGGVLRLGRHCFKHEWTTGKQLKRSKELARDLEVASAYVTSLLPLPVEDGPVRTNWVYQPSAMLGGDAFGYTQLSDHLYCAYLIDVSGHGAGAAMHSVSVMNLLRRRALPYADMADPSQVLSALNALFPMEEHADMYFTAWYGVFDIRTRRLAYASAGHHPAYLVPPWPAQVEALQTRNPIIGAVPGKTYNAGEIVVPPESRLYLFSDGVFEIITRDGLQWGLTDFLPLLTANVTPAGQEALGLLEAVTKVAGTGQFDDDFSLLVITLD